MMFRRQNHIIIVIVTVITFIVYVCLRMTYKGLGDEKQIFWSKATKSASEKQKRSKYNKISKKRKRKRNEGMTHKNYIYYTQTKVISYVCITVQFG